MKAKQVKAYAVKERFESMTVIVFARSGVAARRLGANVHDVEFESIESCIRAPWADQYQGAGKIPAQAWIDNGYSQTCDYCETVVFGDETEDEDGNPQEPIFDGTRCYCGPGCKEAREQEAQSRKASGEAFLARIKAERPFLTFTTLRCDFPWVYNSAEYTFEGAKVGGGVSEDKDGNLSWHVAAGDAEAYASIASRAAQP